MPMRDLIQQHTGNRPLPQEDIERECAAIIKVACPHCRAPTGSHCASAINTIVWPPHLCRMDAYTHRLCPSEDWPMQTAVFRDRLNYVKSIPAQAPKTFLTWKTVVQQRLVKTNEYGRPVQQHAVMDDNTQQED